MRRAAAAMTIPTTAEVGAALSVATFWFRPFVAVCAFAGLRLGEAAGLQVGDVDFLRRTITGLVAYTLHDLRHFYASGLIAAGCDVVTVQRALGHSSATITLGVYAHLWPTAENRTRAAASDLINAALQDHADYLRTKSQ